MDYSGTGTTTWAEDFSDLRAPNGWTERSAPGRRRALDSSAFMLRTVTPAQAPAAPDSGALPGELLTEAVATNLEDRRVLLRVFRKLAGDAKITLPTHASLVKFLEALPRDKHLPTVSPDGDGGLTLAWPIHGRGRTLITVANGVLYVVGNAGTPQATYMPEVDLTGTLPDGLLALIPE